MQYLLKFKTKIVYFIELNWPRIILNWIFYWIELAQNNFELNILFNWILAFFSDWIIFLNWILIIFFWIENWIESFSTVFFWIKNWIESFSTVFFWINNWIESFSTVFFWIKNWIESFSREIQSLIESSNCTSQGYPLLCALRARDNYPDFQCGLKAPKAGLKTANWPKDRQLGARSEPKLLVGNIYFFTDVTFPVHCMVGDWKQWGECSATCNGGTKTRAREVVQE